jgi:hypothetical protein
VVCLRDCIPLSFVQGLITFLVNENGFNSDRVTKVCVFFYYLYKVLTLAFHKSIFLFLSNKERYILNILVSLFI